MRVLACVFLVLACLFQPRTARADTAPALRRIAVLVGSNDAPAGRAPLRYAHADAQLLAEALLRVGHFEPRDVHVLSDPEPAALSATLASAAADIQAAHGDAMFVFYYSGHSDGQSLFPHGEAVPLVSLRDAIEQIGARIRVGVLDTCRGGSWTQAKGLTVGPPLDPADLLNVTTEGTALVSSSSGLESAHEAEALGGSFFTHHFVAGLLGAADRAGDGNITLEEAFDYAKERTVRDSARLAAVPQHPSFDLQLRGRQDIVLTTISTSPSALEVMQTSDTIEVIHLPSGTTIAEVPPTSRGVRIAVPPAHYLVRSVIGGQVRSREFDVPPGTTVPVIEGQLEATGDPRLALKDASPEHPRLFTDPSTPGAGQWLLALAAGVSNSSLPGSVVANGTTISNVSSRYFAFSDDLMVGLTDRLALNVPGGLAYRFGTSGSSETVLTGGVSLGGLYPVGLGIVLDPYLGLSERIWLAPQHSLYLTAGAYFPFVARPSPQIQDTSLGHTFDTAVGITYGVTIGDVVALHLGVAAWSEEGVGPGRSPFEFVSLTVGSPLRFANQQLPLVQVRVFKRTTLDFMANWAYYPASGRYSDSYLVGFTTMWGRP